MCAGWHGTVAWHGVACNCCVYYFCPVVGPMESVGMPNETRSVAYAENAQAQLRRLAQALDMPVEAFFGTAPLEPDAAKMAELFRLWNAIRDPEIRQALLLTARAFVEREAEAPLAAE